MNIRVAIAIYTVAWAGVAALVIAGLAYLGVSIWLSVFLAYLLFVSVNGTIAYRHRAKQHALHGTQPPQYFRYLLVGEKPIGKIHVPRPIRLILGLLIGCGGLAFLPLALLLAVSSLSFEALSPITALVPVILFALGLGFAYVGVCLLLWNGNGPLLQRPRINHRRRGDDA